MALLSWNELEATLVALEYPNHRDGLIDMEVALLDSVSHEDLHREGLGTRFEPGQVARGIVF